MPNIRKALLKTDIAMFFCVLFGITTIFLILFADVSSASTTLESKLGTAKTSGTIKYQYDEGTQRIMKDDNGKKTYYVNDMYEEDSDGTKRKYIYVNGMKIATTKTKSGTTGSTTTYHHSDHLGGSNVSTNENAQLTEVNDYYPFGSSRIEEKAQNYDSNYLYTGKELDRTSGLYYYGARYYDPSIGRFTSVDPVLGDIENPQTLNKYAYVSNNPMKYVDPTGMWGVSYLTGSRSHQIITQVALRMAGRHSDLNEILNKNDNTKIIVGASVYADIFVKVKKSEADPSFHSTTPSDIKTATALKNRMMGHAKRFFESDSLYEFGRLLHMVQDSYCPSHVERDENGNIKAFYDYEQQKKLKHIKGDSIKNAELDALVGAVEASKKLIELKYDPNATWEDAKDYLNKEVWALDKDATVGTSGEKYKKD